MPVYQTISPVKGTFHQDDGRFGSTAGRVFPYFLYFGQTFAQF